MLGVPELARAYRVPLFDYERPGDGVLIHNGHGLMLAVMDACPELRWVVDFSGLREASQRLCSFLAGLTCRPTLIAGALVFAVDDPTSAAVAMASAASDWTVTLTNKPDVMPGRLVFEFDELAQRVHELGQADAIRRRGCARTS